MRKIETKKLAAAVTALALCAGVLTGCGGAASGTASSTAASSASSEASSEEADEMAAKNVADLIDAIYVQERNEDTDAQCEAAKAAWDALTDTQKELVEGENADPDYFGRDTGDASKDDARNQDDIGDNELLVVSFGTSCTWLMMICAAPSPHRSSSTMFRPVTAKRSTTCSRPWTALWKTA